VTRTPRGRAVLREHADRSQPCGYTRARAQAHVQYEADVRQPHLAHGSEVQHALRLGEHVRRALAQREGVLVALGNLWRDDREELTDTRCEARVQGAALSYLIEIPDQSLIKA
jgi:hypothetical protein